MALLINDACINCGVCVPECPNNAIVEGDEHFRIRAGRCTECIDVEGGPTCRSLCPIDNCIEVNPRRVETPEELRAKKKRIDARSRVEEALALLDL